MHNIPLELKAATAATATTSFNATGRYSSECMPAQRYNNKNNGHNMWFYYGYTIGEDINKTFLFCFWKSTTNDSLCFISTENAKEATNSNRSKNES